MSAHIRPQLNLGSSLNLDTQQAFDFGFNKLKTSSSKDLCKKVLLINSMDSLIDTNVSSRAQEMKKRFRTKQEWRKYLFDEFVSGSDPDMEDPNISFNILNQADSMDSLSILLNCLQITQKKQNVTNKSKFSASSFRSVRSKTIGKNRNTSKVKSFKMPRF